MLPDLSSPLYLVFGAALFALVTRFPRPKIPSLNISWPVIKVQAQRQTCAGIQVTDVMLTVSGKRPGSSGPKFEVAAYFVFKTRKK